MNKATYHLLDVFTDHQFGGNQLAVFPDSSEINPDLMQQIACEFNLSETVFLFPKNPDDSYEMRIFTPGMELPTAGHPTIGTAFVIGNSLELDNGFHTLSLKQKVGLIKVEILVENNSVQSATMFQPLPAFLEKYENRDEFTSLLGLSSGDLMDHPIQKISCGVPYIIIPVASLEAIKRIRFRLDIWSTIAKNLQAFIYCFTPNGQLENSDLHGRMFAPEAGILEDPATGSANGPLGCYVTKYGIKSSPFISEQGFEMGRPSIIQIGIDTDPGGKITQVRVGGRSVMVGRGDFFLPH